MCHRVVKFQLSGSRPAFPTFNTPVRCIQLMHLCFSLELFVVHQKWKPSGQSPTRHSVHVVTEIVDDVRFQSVQKIECFALRYAYVVVVFVSHFFPTENKVPNNYSTFRKKQNFKKFEKSSDFNGERGEG